MSRDCPECGDPVLKTGDTGRFLCINCNETWSDEEAPATGSPLDVTARPDAVIVHVPGRRRGFGTHPIRLNPDAARRLAEALNVSADDADRRGGDAP